MGIVYAMLGAGFFALGNVCAKRGHRMYSGDDGAPVTALVNVAVLGVVTAVVIWRSGFLWTWQGIIAFIIAGVLTTGLGRLTSMAAIRLIGPSRATLYKVTAPVFTVVTAYLTLGERLSPLEGIGALVVLVGLWLLTSEGRAGSVHPVAASEPSFPMYASSGAAEAGGAAPVSAALDASNTPRPEDTVPLSGTLLGLAAALFFGLGFVVRKWGLALMPAVVPGALIGAAAGLVTNFGLAWMRRGWRDTVKTALRDVPVWFKLSGLATSMALLSQFGALSLLSASVVSVFLATEPLWTLILGRLIFPGQESVTKRVIMSTVVIVTGVIVMILA